MDQRIQTPEWVKDAIFYQIFPERFAKSSAVPKPNNLEPWDSPPTIFGFKGGDLIGIVERLDYLQDLGISAIYFTPIFKSTAPHRYHTYDYYQVDPILGGNHALRHLIDEAHARGIRVVLDGVFNHASRGFFQFNHILENGPASPYIDWFFIRQFPVRAYERRHQYEGWAGLPALPKFNTRTPAVREFLWDVGRYWIDYGIDGWRLDVPNEIDDDEFWREFRRRVKSANPEAYIVGEIWGDAQRWLQGDQFDAVMNYLFTRACLSFFIREFDRSMIRKLGENRIPKLGARGFSRYILDLLNLYHPEITQAQLNLLDSHDMPRFFSLARGDESALRLATLFQMTYPGVPCIYYGDEIGLGVSVPPGQRPRFDPATDPDVRRTFPWDESYWNHDLRSYFKRCIALRKAHPSLRRGDFTILRAERGLFVYRRHLPNETLVIALNVNDQPVAVDFYVGQQLRSGTLLRDVWSGEITRVERSRMAGGSIPAREGRVWLAIEAEQSEYESFQVGG